MEKKKEQQGQVYITTEKLLIKKLVLLAEIDKPFFTKKNNLALKPQKSAYKKYSQKVYIKKF